MKLKYGMNPYHPDAELVDPGSALRVLNGIPSFINILDALNGWQLVQEARTFAAPPVAASFQHVSPSGVAIGNTLTDKERTAIAVSLGSIRDGEILSACERHGITLIDIGIRLFHHG